jgi:4-amino-4-deoxy-L-arabinose transferase-like glycosyltransferase
MLCLPWVIAVQVATEGAFLREAIGRHVLDRAVADQAINNQGGPLWYYVPVVVAFVLPYLPFVVTGWWMAWRRGRLGQAPLVVILGVWALVTVVVFSLFKTKLPHYILPVLPALALTAAAGLSYITRVIPARLIGAGYYLAGGLLVLGLSAVGWRYLPEPVSHLTPFLVVPAVLLGVFLLLSAYHWFSGRLLDSAASLSAGLVVVVLLLFHGLLPAMDPLRASRMVTNQVRAMGPDYELGAVGFREPSLVWNLGRNVAMFGRRRPGPALEFLLEKPGRVVLVEKRVYDEWSRDTTETLPRAVWSGTALDLQSELFTELLLLQPENK